MKILQVVDCQNCKKEFETTLQKIRAGRGKFCSNKCKWEYTGKRLKGNDYWKKTTATQFKEHSKLGKSNAYKRFRQFIFDRDKTCKGCGAEKKLVLHHIKNRNLFPELLMEEDNCIILCRKCHINIHRTDL